MFQLTRIAAIAMISVVPFAMANTSSLSVDQNSVVNPKGAVMAESLNNKDQQYTDGAYEVAPGVWSVTGLGMDNVNVIETENGIVVFDGGMTRDYARKAMSLLPERVAEQPVVGLIYTHWHYIIGAGEWNVTDDTMVVAHKNHNSELHAAVDTESPLSSVRQVRASIQLGAFLPKEGADAPSVTGQADVTVDDISKYVAPNKLVGDGETSIIIDGVEFVTHAGHTDTLDGISIYVPSKKVSVDNTYWAHGLFNFSTLRGDRWRDIDLLEQAAQWLLDQDIEHSLKVHGKPVTGKIFKAQLSDQMGTIKALVEETEKAIGQGMAPDEIQYQVKLPKELAESPHLEENYGEFSYHTRRYYNHVMHWFGNDSIELHPLPRNDEANKMIEAMGGMDTVVKRAEKAGKKGEYQWSAQLATYAIRAGSIEARQVKANALRSMAQKATASNTRNWMLTHALVLEGKLELPIVLTGDY
ncbi:alkyl sulfatase dimerization domain-containing protein [Endozoicomonas numazuensis]|uniref:Metallo-beta-lactamase domain-containing protein n=1 Tax=Endozoicomonas numazuensis TaxID=1137799 RepID=A0A081NHK1_9GAMM|nr:alkyl sulfatase dimerization domain-containing protein [Endozoicomonas numazuensis]KEQ17924.1 hypothetical protein GZ78_09865 [Endozoicomonas numazuensis]